MGENCIYEPHSVPEVLPQSPVTSLTSGNASVTSAKTPTAIMCPGGREGRGASYSVWGNVVTHTHNKIYVVQGLSRVFP